MRTFNCGIGMVLAVNPAEVEDVVRDLTTAGETVHTIGRITPGERGCTVTGGADTWRHTWQRNAHAP